MANGPHTDWTKICGEKYLGGNRNIGRNIDPPKGSAFWNGIRQIRKIIDQHSKWKASNGGKIYIWEDKWIGSLDVKLKEDAKLKKPIE